MVRHTRGISKPCRAAIRAYSSASQALAVAAIAAINAAFLPRCYTSAHQAEPRGTCSSGGCSFTPFTPFPLLDQVQPIHVPWLSYLTYTTWCDTLVVSPSPAIRAYPSSSKRQSRAVVAIATFHFADQVHCLLSAGAHAGAASRWTGSTSF